MVKRIVERAYWSWYAGRTGTKWAAIVAGTGSDAGAGGDPGTGVSASDAGTGAVAGL